jgi:hypothetical protein
MPDPLAAKIPEELNAMTVLVIVGKDEEPE